MFDFFVGSLSPFIVIVTYAIAEILKRVVFAKKQNLKTFIPIICAVIGGIMGITIYLVYPMGIADTNAIAAITDGIFSGLAATGCNQIYKQIYKSKDYVNEYHEDKAKEQVTPEDHDA